MSFPGKKGACYALKGPKGQANLKQVEFLKPAWNYAWCTGKSDDQPDTIEFVPQVWGGAKTEEMFKERLERDIVPHIKAGTCQRLLAFNEPDKKEQSNMKVEDCLRLWPMLEELGVPLCSPSCANPMGCAKKRHATKDDDACNQGVSGSWNTDFFQGVQKHGYRCDYLGVHWYGGPSFPAFQKRMLDIYESQGSKYPLLLTEFAVADWTALGKKAADNRYTRAQVLDFMKKALPWMEKQDWIAGYAWFPYNPACAPQGTCSALFSADGKPTALGRYYASVSSENPSGNQDIKVLG